MTTPGSDVGSRSHDFPLRLGRVEDFARVESLLRAAQFDVETVCQLLRIREMADLSAVKPDAVDLAAASQTLALLIRVFLFTETIERCELECVIGPDALSSLLALDILRLGSFDSSGETGLEAYYSTVFLYPVSGLLIASDRRNNPDGSPFTTPPDIVFPAIFGGTLLFLKVIAKTPAVDALDLCSGSGVAALLLSMDTERVVASDITARATHFARFNSMLNRRHNVDVVQGDLYSAVEGQTFERIVAHPPYVPSLSRTAIYRYGGETGEALVRRIVEGLPQHLRRGGTFYSMCIGLDTTEGQLETRARNWLGESEKEFDVIFAFSDERTPKQFARETVEHLQESDPSAIERWDQLFGSIGARKLVYGALVIHRRADQAVTEHGRRPEPITVRSTLSPATDGACFEWAVRWQHFRSQPGALDNLARSRPRLATHLRARVTHAVQDGRLVPSEFLLETDRPFASATRVDPWIVQLVAEFDGSRTAMELYQAARDASMLPEHFTRADFLNMVAALIERGYLEVDDPVLVQFVR